MEYDISHTVELWPFIAVAQAVVTKLDSYTRGHKVLTLTALTKTTSLSLAFLLRFGQRLNRQGIMRYLVAFAIGATTLPLLQSSQAQAAEPIFTQSEVGATLAQSEESVTATLPLNGVYLYGQSPEPDQMGAAYMVFEARNGLAIGAFYMPNSSFDCFYGDVRPTEMALTVVDSYSQESFPYAIALESVDAVADADGSGTSLELTIDGFHQLSELSDVDRQILSVCQADLEDQVW